MPTHAEIVKFDTEASPGTIRLIESGKFYRAYNHSAWLFHTCLAEHKVMRKYVKALKEDVLYLGFPIESLENTIGNRLTGKSKHGIDVILSVDEIPDEAGYIEWCKTVETSDSSKAEFNFLPLAGADAEREVIKRIRLFPMENRSMIECVTFLAELRQLLSNK